MEDKKFFIDEPVIVSMFIGELGWFLQRWQGYLRFLKQEKHKDHKFLLVANSAYHAYVNDFIAWTVDLPDEFKALKLDQDCYEAVLPNSPPGSFLPANIYSDLVNYIKTLYNNDKGKLILPPRGCNFWIDDKPQVFAKYKSNLEFKPTKPTISVMPRKRTRAANRNVPEFVWKETVDILSKTFQVVLLGTPSGACLGDYKGDNVINLINYDGEDKTEETIKYLNNSLCSISSQSGGTHISLFCDCPSYIIGHEKDRHARTENRLDTAVSFRYVMDYRCIDGKTIYEDVMSFITTLQSSNYYEIRSNPMQRPSLGLYFRDRKNLVGAEIGVFTGLNSLSILKSLDIKKLYLIDQYDYNRNISGTKLSKENAEKVHEVAKNRLDPFKDKIVWINKESSKSIEDIKDELDFVYVDGDHKYEAVKKDIELYYPLLKEDGMMSFHDFDAPDENNGVVQAVHEYFDPLGIHVFSDVCRDDSRTKEGWILKPTEFHKIINRDVQILRELLNEK